MISTPPIRFIRFKGQTAYLAHVILFTLPYVSSADTHYVSLTGEHIAPYTSLSTAATNIQTAVSAATSGDVVLVATGTYVLSATISVPNDITVTGAGPGETIVDGNNAVQCFSLSATATVTEMKITKGYAVNSGGGVAGGILFSCILSGNSAISTTYGTRAAGGAKESKLYNCLITGNSSVAYGYSAHACGGTFGGTLYNCTLADNLVTGYDIFLNASNGTLYNCIVWQGNSGDCSFYTCWMTDPGFVGNGDYSLREDSPCINIGNTNYVVGATDLARNPRIINEAVDIGAYENTRIQLTFDAQAGTANPTSKSAAYGSVYGALATASRTGFTFGGWWTGPEGTGTLVTSSTTVSTTVDQTLYACWITDTFAVISGSTAIPIGETNAVQASSDNSGDGGYSVKCGGVGLLDDGEMAGIECVVTGPGVLAFDWKVSSEADYDVLRFYEVGGTTTNVISGTGEGWTRVYLTVQGETNVLHTFRWEYEKDPIGDYVGDDCGWVDAITWVPFCSLTVNSGTGDGWYPEGSLVTVSADPDPMYMEFAEWTGNATGALDDAYAATTLLTMPTNSVILTATYRASIARASGSYGRSYTICGTSGGLSTDATAGSPSGTPVVKLGGTGVVPNDGFVAFETVVSGSGLVTFWWKVSSESNADYLKFKVDGAQIAAISGTKGIGVLYSYRVEGAGAPHTLRWEYVKNGALASSTDAGWVDDIVWTGDVPDPVIAPDVRTAAVTNGNFTLSFIGERGIPYTVYSNATLSVLGWAPMDIEPQERGETNGLFRFETLIVPPAGQPSCFYRVIGGNQP